MTPFMQNIANSIKPFFSKWLYSNGNLGLTSTVFLIVYVSALLVMVSKARTGGTIPKVRRIAGLDAVDEVVGRATEMGRPVLYSPGIGDLTSADTLASFNVLGHVAKLIAKYDARMIVCNRTPPVQPITESIVRAAYFEVGKPDAYREDDVRFLTNDQFGYAAGVVGIMNREGVAALVLIGSFYAESLIFAEAGNQAGAIQVAATSSTSQTPFFVVACDYCLIGEEIYVAGAYLGQDRVRLATIVVQDWGKQFTLIVIVLGIIAATIGSFTGVKTNVIIDLLRLY
ncbi:MAG: hypothetical protein LLG09_02685 [Negativicutes bacterium]|nr:hypothetical protein [Negativicutes bacterium]